MPVRFREVASCAAFLLLSNVAHATLIWEGGVSQGLSIFKNLGSEPWGATENCATGTISPFEDAQRGTVWRYHKPTDSPRCENHGIRIGGVPYAVVNNSVYFIGWWNKLSTSANNNANFQWKAYDNHIQNWPIVLKMVNGRATMLQRQPNVQVFTIWSAPLSANVWTHWVLSIRTSDQLLGGYVELWMNGVRQNFNDGSQRWMCRTFDGGHVCPKWGIYGGTGTLMNNYVDELKIGTTFGDVAMVIGTPTPTPTATNTPPSVTPTPSPTPTATPTPGGFSGYYRLMARHSGKAVVVQSASTANSANIFQWTYGGTNTNDEWQLLAIGGGYYRLINRHSGKDMVVASASTAEGANIFQFAYGGTNTNDEWAVVDAGGGYWRLTNRHSGKSAEVAGGGASDGADVAQRTYTGATHQQFQILAVP
jgi:hypothetical protein